MWSGMVVVINGLVYSSFCLIKISEGLIQLPFLFEDAIDSFGHCIFVRVTVLGHADLASVLNEHIDIGFGAVLDAPIRMMHERTIRELTVAERLL